MKFIFFSSSFMNDFNLVCEFVIFVGFCWTLVTIGSSLIAFFTLLVEYPMHRIIFKILIEKEKCNLWQFHSFPFFPFSFKVKWAFDSHGIIFTIGIDFLGDRSPTYVLWVWRCSNQWIRTFKRWTLEMQMVFIKDWNAKTDDCFYSEYTRTRFYSWLLQHCVYTRFIQKGNHNEKKNIKWNKYFSFSFNIFRQFMWDFHILWRFKKSAVKCILSPPPKSIL